VYGLGLIAKTDSQDSQLYYLSDGLASTTGLTDGEGSVVGTYTYDVFGAIRSETGGQANDFKFTGQQLDSETAFYYLRARYYDPAIGRFLGQDPLRGIVGVPLSQNLYPYVLNNPVNLVDPSGLCAFGLPCPGPIEDVTECVGNGLDCVKEPAAEFIDALDNGYVDLNVTAGMWGVGLTGGLQLSLDEGIHPYLGGGVMTPGISASLSVAPNQSITTGWSCGGQGFYPVWHGIGPSGQAGWAGIGDKENGFFGEIGVGVGAPGGGATCYYVGSLPWW
jgi:RHS repeat-associated protein